MSEVVRAEDEATDNTEQFTRLIRDHRAGQEDRTEIMAERA